MSRYNSGFSQRCKQRFHGFSEAPLLLAESAPLTWTSANQDEFHALPVDFSHHNAAIELIPQRYVEESATHALCAESINASLFAPSLPQSRIAPALMIGSAPSCRASEAPDCDLSHIFPEVLPAHWSTFWPSLQRAAQFNKEQETDAGTCSECSPLERDVSIVDWSLLPQPPCPLRTHFHVERFHHLPVQDSIHLLQLPHTADHVHQLHPTWCELAPFTFDVFTERTQQIRDTTSAFHPLHPLSHSASMEHVESSFEQLPPPHDTALLLASSGEILASHFSAISFNSNHTDDIDILPLFDPPEVARRHETPDVLFINLRDPLPELDLIFRKLIDTTLENNCVPLPDLEMWQLNETHNPLKHWQIPSLREITNQLLDPVLRGDALPKHELLPTDLVEKYAVPPDAALDARLRIALLNRFIAAYHRLYDKSFDHEAKTESIPLQQLTSAHLDLPDYIFDDTLDAHIAMETGDAAFFDESASSAQYIEPSTDSHTVEPQVIAPPQDSLPISQSATTDHTSAPIQSAPPVPEVKQDNLVALPFASISFNEQKLVQQLLSSSQLLLFAWSDRFHLLHMVALWVYNVLLNSRKSVCISCSGNMIDLLQNWLQAFLEDEISVNIVRVDQVDNAGTELSGFDPGIHRVCLLTPAVSAFVTTTMRDFLSHHGALLYVDTHLCQVERWDNCVQVCAQFLQACKHRVQVNVATCVPPGDMSRFEILFENLSISSLRVLPCDTLAEFFADKEHIPTSTVYIHQFGHNDDPHIAVAVDTISDAAKDLVEELNDLIPEGHYTSVEDFTCDMIKETIKTLTDCPQDECDRKRVIQVLRLYAAMYWIVATITKLVEEGMIPALRYLEQVEGKKISSRYPVLHDLHSFMKDYTKYRIADSNPKFEIIARILQPILGQTDDQCVAVLSRTEHEFATIAACVRELDPNVPVYSVHEEGDRIVLKHKSKPVDWPAMFTEHVVFLLSVDSLAKIDSKFLPKHCAQILLTNQDLTALIPVSLTKRLLQSKCTMHVLAHEVNAHTRTDEALLCWMRNAVAHRPVEQSIDIASILKATVADAMRLVESLLQDVPNLNDVIPTVEILQTVIVTESFLRETRLMDILSQRHMDMIERSHYTHNGEHDPSIIVSPLSCIVVFNHWPARKTTHQQQNVFETLYTLSQQYEMCHVIVSPLNEESVRSSMEIESLCISLPTCVVWHYARQDHEAADIIVDIVRKTKNQVPPDTRIFEQENEVEAYLCRSFHLSKCFNAYAAQYLMGRYSMGDLLALSPEQLEKEVGAHLPRKSLSAFCAAVEWLEVNRPTSLEVADVETYSNVSLSDSIAPAAQVFGSVVHPHRSEVSSAIHLPSLQTREATPLSTHFRSPVQTPPATDRRQLLWNLNSPSQFAAGSVNVNSSSPRDELRFLKESSAGQSRSNQPYTTKSIRHYAIHDDIHAGSKRKQSFTSASPPQQRKRRKTLTPLHKTPQERIETPLQAYRRRKQANQPVQVGRFRILDDDQDSDDSSTVDSTLHSKKTSIPRGKGGHIQNGISGTKQSRGSILDEIKRLKQVRQGVVNK